MILEVEAARCVRTQTRMHHEDQLGPNCVGIDGSAGDADARKTSIALPSNVTCDVNKVKIKFPQHLARVLLSGGRVDSSAHAAVGPWLGLLLPQPGQPHSPPGARRFPGRIQNLHHDHIRIECRQIALRHKLAAEHSRKIIQRVVLWRT